MAKLTHLQRLIKMGVLKGLISELYERISDQLIGKEKLSRNKQRREEDIALITNDQWDRILRL